MTKEKKMALAKAREKGSNEGKELTKKTVIPGWLKQLNKETIKSLSVDSDLLDKPAKEAKKDEKIQKDKPSNSTSTDIIVAADAKEVIDASVIGNRAIVPGATDEKATVPFNISAPNPDNTFIMKDGKLITKAEAEAKSDPSLEYIKEGIRKYLGYNADIYFEKMPSGIINMSIIRPNGYTENYPLDIDGIIDGGTKARLGIRTQFGTMYVPLDEQEVCSRALQSVFYAATEEEFKNVIAKYCYHPQVYEIVDFSGIKVDIPDNTVFKNNLSILLDKINQETNGNIPRMRVKYISDNEFKLISDDKVKKPFESMRNLQRGFIAEFKNGKYKITKGKEN